MHIVTAHFKALILLCAPQCDW